jgi:hypothetical protein
VVVITGAAPNDAIPPEAPNNCPHPLFEFWLRAPGGAWTLVQPYSASNTLRWDTKGKPAGSYLFSVWARDASSTGLHGTRPNSYDALAIFQYMLTAAHCTAMSASAAPPSTAPAGTPVTITGNAAGCPYPLYAFWLLPPGGSWKLVKPYSFSKDYSWSTAGLAAGSYLFSVWARDASSRNTYDAFTTVPYTLTVTACTAMSASAAPPSHATAGTPVTITGAATGCPNPLYEFWLLPPSGSWTLVQRYTNSKTFGWTTTGKTPGSYLFSVWARDSSSPGTNGTPPNKYDAFSTLQYTLS